MLFTDTNFKVFLKRFLSRPLETNTVDIFTGKKVLNLEPSGSLTNCSPLKRRQDVEASFLADHPSALQSQRQRSHWDRATFCGLHQRPPPNTPWTQPKRYTHTLTPQTQLQMYTHTPTPKKVDTHTHTGWTQPLKHMHTCTHTLNQLQKHTHWHGLTVLGTISGMRPPRPAYTPSPNGNLYTCDVTAANQRGRPFSSKWQSRLQDMLTPSSSRAYAMGCAIITLLLLTVLLIFYFLGEISYSSIFICLF